MQIGCKKINNSLLYEKAKQSSLKSWAYGFGYFLGFVVALLMILISTLNLLLGNPLVFESMGMLVLSTLKTTFVDFIFPVVFLKSFQKYLQEKWKIVEDCKVQIV